MNKIILLLLCIIAAPLSAKKEGFVYGKVGTGFVEIINAGVGYRYFDDHLGMDFSLNGGTMVFVNTLSVKGLVLYRFQPQCSSSFYTGFGAGGQGTYIPLPMGLGTGSSVSPTIEAVFGHQWKLDNGMKLFLQLSGSCPVRDPLPFGRLELGVGY